MEPILATREAVSPTASREPQIEQHTLLTSLVLHLATCYRAYRAWVGWHQ